MRTVNVEYYVAQHAPETLHHLSGMAGSVRAVDALRRCAVWGNVREPLRLINIAVYQANLADRTVT
jgi:transcriptional regulator with AAA-type ATPase domain